MKALLVMGVLILSPVLGHAGDQEFDLRKVDQQAHLAVSYGLAMTSTMLFEKHQHSRLESILYGSLVTMTVGFAKEYAYDKKPSDGDLIADALGTALSAGIVYSFDF